MGGMPGTRRYGFARRLRPGPVQRIDDLRHLLWLRGRHSFVARIAIGVEQATTSSWMGISAAMRSSLRKLRIHVESSVQIWHHRVLRNFVVICLSPSWSCGLMGSR